MNVQSEIRHNPDAVIFKLWRIQKWHKDKLAQAYIRLSTRNIFKLVKVTGRLNGFIDEVYDAARREIGAGASTSNQDAAVAALGESGRCVNIMKEYADQFSVNLRDALNGDKPVTKDSLYYIFSQTKKLSSEFFVEALRSIVNEKRRCKELGIAEGFDFNPWAKKFREQ